MHQLDKPIIIILLTLTLFLLSFSPGMFLLNINNTSARNDLDFKFASSSFIFLIIGYNIMLISSFFYNHEKRQCYVSFMKRIKTYNDNYNLSHLMTMFKLLLVKIFIISFSILLGMAYFILEDKQLFLEVPYYRCFSIGFVFLITVIISTLSVFGMRWLYEKRDELLPEYDPINI